MSDDVPTSAGARRLLRHIPATAVARNWPSMASCGGGARCRSPPGHSSSGRASPRPIASDSPVRMYRRSDRCIPRIAEICRSSALFRLQSSTSRSSRSTRLGGMSRCSATASRQCQSSRATASSRRERPLSPETLRHRLRLNDSSTSSCQAAISCCIQSTRPSDSSCPSIVRQSCSRCRTSSTAYSSWACVSGRCRQSVRVSPLLVGRLRKRRTIEA